MHFIQICFYIGSWKWLFNFKWKILIETTISKLREWERDWKRKVVEEYVLSKCIILKVHQLIEILFSSVMPMRIITHDSFTCLRWLHKFNWILYTHIAKNKMKLNKAWPVWIPKHLFTYANYSSINIKMFEHNLNAKSTQNTKLKREIKNPILIFKVAYFCQIQWPNILTIGYEMPVSMGRRRKMEHAFAWLIDSKKMSIKNMLYSMPRPSQILYLKSNFMPNKLNRGKPYLFGNSKL